MPSPGFGDREVRELEMEVRANRREMLPWGGSRRMSDRGSFASDATNDGFPISGNSLSHRYLLIPNL